MAYNLTLIDRTGRHATVLLAPDRPAIVQDLRYATNHQIGVEWPRHARLSQTLERAEFLERMLATPGLDGPALEARFLAPPLHRRRYALGFGTVYTAIYRPTKGTAQLAWPGLARWKKGFEAFSEDTRSIVYPAGGIPYEAVARHRHPTQQDDRRTTGETRGITP
jgi:predicted choloylglycine hydrolase